VIGRIVADFEHFVAMPPLDGNLLGDFADYSCGSLEDRAVRGVTIHLNWKMPGIPMREVTNFVAHALEMKGFRPVLRDNSSGDPEVRVPFAFRNTASY
jgi:hypothetical protein